MQSSSATAQTTTTQTVSAPSKQQEISVANVSATVDEKKEGSVADSCKGGDGEVIVGTSETSNGIVPPKSAFANTQAVHQGMPALENQFQSMAMNEVPITVHHDKEGENGENFFLDILGKFFTGLAVLCWRKQKESEGKGKGATFTLSLPNSPVSDTSVE